MSQLPNDRMQAMRNLRQVILDNLPEGFTESNKTAFHQYLQPMKLICPKKIMLLLSLILSGLIQLNAQILRPSERTFRVFRIGRQNTSLSMFLINVENGYHMNMVRVHPGQAA